MDMECIIIHWRYPCKYKYGYGYEVQNQMKENSTTMNTVMRHSYKINEKIFVNL